ncbi:hypothetical protein [Microcella frigidaquae]|uniref:Uncharacterized protein n=1 Tax=Microcella frigidaquae TaxID=424758 RepID=A0A840X3V4_9MICO|nr:hypothetical protein [Microcella frigidaquae]MBB5617183.1 hypothetical protein [Microcella frigidaquae]NHN45117.1 hypothetical protein [Microcella frigidaquae]
MDWGNSALQWLASEEGWRVLSGAIIPALAIITAGIIAALIGRGTTRRLIAMQQRDALGAALGGFLLAGRKAAEWTVLSDLERAQLDHLIAEAETRIRLLPIAGAGLAASWAAHELAAMKRDSAGFQFQAQQTLAEYRDRLVAWSERPRQAKKLFGADLERWRYEEAATPSDDGPTTRGGGEGAHAPEDTWIPQTSASEPSPLTPEPPTAVATATGSMPLIITSPLPASTVRDRVLPASAG